MVIPKYDEMIKPILENISDSGTLTTENMYKFLVNHFNLSEEETSLTHQSGDIVFKNRGRFAIMELNQSKLITLSSIRGEYSVTSRGQSVLEENPNKINREYLKRFPEYLEFLERSKNKSKKSSLKSNVFKDIQEIESDDQIPKTQKKVYQDARLGQGKFRRNLLKLWRGCSVTGYANKELLIASHIKPWKFSNPYERLDKYNGLLLMPNLDKLFDSGLISFEDNGRIIISNRLSHNDLNKLNIKESMLVELKNENIKYIRFHRSSIFS